jgi:OPA family glycerol-3-phosphate transporter-like MFS transporter 1/2
MGIWNTHTSVENVTGSLVATVMLRYGWGWSFVAPATPCCSGEVATLPHPVRPRCRPVARKGKSKGKEDAAGSTCCCSPIGEGSTWLAFEILLLDIVGIT